MNKGPSLDKNPKKDDTPNTDNFCYKNSVFVFGLDGLY
jgi:hypothetical protein